MTRKNSTVNPKAGTLKQENRALRTKSNASIVKSIAFALLMSITLPAISGEQDELTDTGVGILAMAEKANAENCCLYTELPATRKVKLGMPSREMVRKADKEAVKNILQSLRESKLNALRFWIQQSDKEMQQNFARETWISVSRNMIVADREISNQFNAEHIDYMAGGAGASDQDMKDLFQVEHVGISQNIGQVVLGDRELVEEFEANLYKVAAPTTSQFVQADQEMIMPAEKSMQHNIAYVGKSYEKL